MEIKQYQQLASRTEKPLDWRERIIHAQLGISSESGELSSAIKKFFIYSKELDITNVAEELGDLAWYMALLANACNLELDTILEENIAKLRKRYPEKYTDQLAVDRLDKQETGETQNRETD